MSANGNEELKEILSQMLDLVASLEQEIRSLEVLTGHRLRHQVTEKLGIPQKTNALHAQVQSLAYSSCKEIDEPGYLFNLVRRHVA